MFEFQISIDLGHSHPLLFLWSLPLKRDARWGLSLGSWGGTRASTCVLLMLQRTIRGEEEGCQQPLELCRSAAKNSRRLKKLRLEMDWTAWDMAGEEDVF